jgi:alpha-tubulin suppressor-like RCC1 family protein
MNTSKLFTIFLVSIFCIATKNLYAQNTKTQLTAAFEHSLVLHNNTVWTWGKYQDFNNEWQNMVKPKITSNLEDIVAISEGCMASHTLAIKKDSTVWAWGNNQYGQVAPQNSNNEAFPIKVTNLKKVIQVAVGKGHSVALKADGTVWIWGWNEYGQLGLGNVIDNSTISKVPNLSDVVAIAAGANHTLALKSDGTVWAWGRNNVGQLGTGTEAMDIRPSRVLTLENVTAISVGGYHNLALTKDGKVFAWGWNSYGQVRNELNENSVLPTVVAIENVKAISAGTLHNIALKTDGTVWSWGDNTFGQVGFSNKSKISAPQKIYLLKDIECISAGDMHSLALDKNGQVWAWGTNENGRLGTKKVDELAPSASFNIHELAVVTYFADFDQAEPENMFSSASIKIFGLEAKSSTNPFEIPITDDYLIDTMYNTIVIGDVLLEGCPTEQILKKLTIHLTCNQNPGVELTWNLSNEDDFYEHFFLERSFDGINWIEVNEALSVERQEVETIFSILDKIDVPNKNTFYRLKQLNCDEIYVYSNIIRSGCSSNEADGFFKSKFTVSIDNPTQKRMTYQLQDIQGKILQKIVLNDKKIAFSDGLKLKEGTYFMFLIDEDLHLVMDSKKLVKVAK